MRKRLIAVPIIICLALVMGLTGCGDSKPYSKYDLSEYVKVGEYKGLDANKVSVSVSNREVRDQIDANVENTKTTEKLEEGKVKDGDKVNIDYEGTIKGKTFEGGSAKGSDLEIGSKSFIDGFEDGLIGEAIGSTKTLKLKFPKDYKSKEVAGKNVEFEVKINYVSTEVVPEYNEEWIEKNSKAKTEEEYEAYVKGKLLEEKKQAETNAQKSDLWTEVVDSSEAKKYPEEEVNNYVEEIETAYKDAAEQQGVEVKELWAQYGIKSQKEYDTQNEEAAKTYVKQQMILYYIADKENLSYTEEEAKKIEDDISKAGYTEETFKQYMGQSIQDYIETTLTYEKVVDFIYKNAHIVDGNKNDDKEKEETQGKDEAKETTRENTTDNNETDSTKATKEAPGADDATSNDEPGGADA